MPGESARAQVERHTLVLLLAINAAMFAIELSAGVLAESTGLLADSLDMLADALVYGAALTAVGSSGRAKTHAARVSGFVQLSLAAVMAAEIARRSLEGSDPLSPVMIGVSLLALAANGTCVALLKKHRHGEVHMRASWIFSTTDVQVNLGVIAAGVLVAATGSRWPDLVVGVAITAIVVRGGLRILREARREATAPP
jgi:Co/Zn/Cd efflux system component